MSKPGRHARSGGAPVRLLVVAGLVLAGAGSVVVGLHGHDQPLASPAATASSSPPTLLVPLGAAVRPSTAAMTTRSEPVVLRIPAIEVAVPVSQLGLRRDHTVEVPSDAQRPGWFRLGPSPGQVGSAVILGHVDSSRGPAVFFRLRELRPGDVVDVIRADGMVAHFAVRLVAQYPKDRFPSARVYGSAGFSALQLVTCGGVFDRRTHHYLSNVVVYTTLVSMTRAS